MVHTCISTVLLTVLEARGRARGYRSMYAEGGVRGGLIVTPHCVKGLMAEGKTLLFVLLISFRSTIQWFEVCLQLVNYHHYLIQKYFHHPK